MAIEIGDIVMALNADNLVKITNLQPASDEKPTLALWHYKTTDTLAQVLAAGYFNNSRKIFQPEDEILVIAAGGMEIIKLVAVPATGNVTTVQVATARKSVSGQHTTVAAADTIVTGLTTVAGIVATLDSDPVAGCQFVTATIGDQAGAPAAGSVIIKTWKSTAAGDTAQVAATTFGKKVNYIAWGT